jgi:hypothetical protein
MDTRKTPATNLWEITTDKSASVYEGVRSNEYDLSGMSLDENRGFS